MGPRHREGKRLHPSGKTDVETDPTVQHHECQDQGRDGFGASPRKGADSGLSGWAARKRWNMTFIVERGQELVPGVRTAGGGPTQGVQAQGLLEGHEGACCGNGQEFGNRVDMCHPKYLNHCLID